MASSSTGYPSQDWQDVDQWQKDFNPSQGPIRGPETIPPGEYEFEITGAELTKTRKTEETLFRLTLKVISSGEHFGTKLERPTFFRSNESINMLGGELQVLGISTKGWQDASAGPLSQRLIEAAKQIKGACFVGVRTDREVNGKTYSNLYVKSLLASAPPADEQPSGSENGTPAQIPNASDYPF